MLRTVYRDSPVLYQPRGRVSQPHGEIGSRVARCELRTTAKAGAIAKRLGGCRIREEPAIFLLRRSDPAHRTAVHARGRHGDDKATIEAIVSRTESLVTAVGIKNHQSIMPQANP